MLISRAKPWICTAVAALWLLMAFLSRNVPAGNVTIATAAGSFAMIFAVFALAVVFTASTVRLEEFPEDGPLGRVKRVFAADLPSQRGKGTSSVGTAIRAGLVTGLAMTLTGLLLASGTEYLARKVGIELPQQDVADAFAAGGVALRCVLFVVLVILTPLVEEFFFRYATAHTLAGATRSQRMGELVTAALFTLMHANVVALVPLFIVSLCCSAVYRRTGNFLAPVVAHSFFNLVSVVVLLFS